MSTNPYESPMATGGMGPTGGFNPNVSEKVNAPGLLLIITASLSIGVQVIFLLIGLLGMGVMAANAQGGEDAAMFMVQMVLGIIGRVIGIGFNAVTLYGGIKLRNLEGYGLAMAGAIIACIPFCSPCCVLGIPFGIWALVVMNDEQVKAAFRR